MWRQYDTSRRHCSFIFKVNFYRIYISAPGASVPGAFSCSSNKKLAASLRSAFLVAGRGHGLICNSLIIKWYLDNSVEMQTFFGCESTPYFVSD